MDKKLSVTVDDVVRLLNEINEMDSTILPKLIKYRVPANKKIAMHPTIQVGERSKKRYEVGLLGILNGLFPTLEDGYGHIAACYSKGRLLKFLRLK